MKVWGVDSHEATRALKYLALLIVIVMALFWVIGGISKVDFLKTLVVIIMLGAMLTSALREVIGSVVLAGLLKLTGSPFHELMFILIPSERTTAFFTFVERTKIEHLAIVFFFVAFTISFLTGSIQIFHSRDNLNLKVEDDEDDEEEEKEEEVEDSI